MAMSATAAIEEQFGVAPLPEFTAPDLLDWLERAPREAIDALPFGAIGLDAARNVVFYSARESQLSGLSPSRNLGRHMFEEVGPCMNNFLVASRYEEAAELDEIVPFVLTLRMRRTPTTLRLLQRPGIARAWLLLLRTGGV